MLYWKNDRNRALPWWPVSSNRVQVSDEDMLGAIKWLASGKAVGLDSLPDRQLKKVLLMNPGIRDKLRLFYEQILNGDRGLP